MPNSFTANLDLTKPEVGADSNLWGGHLNGDMDILDSIFTSATTMLVSTVLKSDTSIADVAVTTKRVLFNLTGITPANTRNLSIQDSDGTLAYTAQVAAATTGLGTVTTGQVAAATATGVALLAAANTFTTSNTIPLTVLSTGVTTTAGDNSTKLATTAYVNNVAPGAAPITNSLGANTAIGFGGYTDGPSIAQGSIGTWFVSGKVTVFNSSGNMICDAKLWDGTTIVDSAQVVATNPNGISISLSGVLATPAGNLKISCISPNVGDGFFAANLSGNSKDSTITAIRIA